MTKNDYHVIVFHLLSYLYECLKEGKEENILSIVNKKVLGVDIPVSYWEYIFVHMCEFGYIEGIECQSVENKIQINRTGEMCITPKGIEYMLNDKMMHEASYFCALTELTNKAT